MPAFELKVNFADLPDILGAMREWLDHNRMNMTHFYSLTDRQGIVTINVGFGLEDHTELFRQRFAAIVATRTQF